MDADVTIYCSDKLFNLLSEFDKELKFLFITSSANLMKLDSSNKENFQEIFNEKIEIEIINSSNKKCERCWHKCESVGLKKEHPSICDRCISNVYGDGENRKNV